MFSQDIYKQYGGQPENNDKLEIIEHNRLIHENIQKDPNLIVIDYLDIKPHYSEDKDGETIIQVVANIKQFDEGDLQNIILDKVLNKNQDDIQIFYNSGGIALIQDDRMIDAENPHIKQHLINNFNIRHWEQDKMTAALNIEPRTPTPKHVYEDFLVNRRISELPHLDRIVRHPIWLEDGTYIDKEGYIENIKTYLIPNYDNIPSIESIDEASKIIRGHFQHFPWASELDEMKAISFLFTIYLKHLIPGNLMMYHFNANRGGSGKGLLLESMHKFIAGEVIATVQFARDSNAGRQKNKLAVNDEKLLRNMSGQLFVGRDIMHVDNLPDNHEITSAALCSLLTSEYHDFHWNYLQTLRRLNTEKLLLCSSGNDNAFENTLERRVIFIELTTPLIEPYTRKGLPDLKKNSLSERNEFLGAMNTVVKAWFDKEKPIGDVVIGSFEGHSQFLSGIIPLLGFESKFEITIAKTSDDQIREDCITIIYDKFTEEKWTANKMWEELGPEIENLYEDDNVYKRDNFDKYFKRYMLPDIVKRPLLYVGKDHFDTHETPPTLMLKRSEKRERIDNVRGYIYWIEIVS